MPCNSNYLNPTNLESETRKVIDMYLWLESNFKGIPDRKASKVEKNSTIYFSKSESDYFINLLCKRCTELAKRNQLDSLLNKANRMSRNLANWWEDHQEADEIRKDLEKKKKQDEKLKKSALSKLSNKEKKILGLN